MGDLTARVRILERRLSGPERATVMVSRGDYLRLVHGEVLRVRVPGVGLLEIMRPMSRGELAAVFRSGGVTMKTYRNVKGHLHLYRCSRPDAATA